MSFKDIIYEFNKSLEEDCDNITNEIVNFKINILSSKKDIKYNAFDKIIPITLTSKQTTYQFTELKGESAIYVFVINCSCPICIVLRLIFLLQPAGCSSIISNGLLFSFLSVNLF